MDGKPVSNDTLAFALGAIIGALIGIGATDEQIRRTFSRRAVSGAIRVMKEKEAAR